MTEFDVIAHYFSQNFPKRTDVILGIGDDAALCSVPNYMQLAVSIDTLVEGVHFPVTTSPEDIGYKALAVNLSDMAAMGATPAWMTLALTCPKVNETWLKRFSQGLLELAQSAQVSLIGGDTTQGPLTITLQISGFVPIGQALRRDGAQPGDGIYVTGTLGDAGLGLALIQETEKIFPKEREAPRCDPPSPVVERLVSLSNHIETWEGVRGRAASKFVKSRLNRPTPCLKIGQALRGIASSAIDISDGLVADLGHILKASSVGATLQLENLPLSNVLHDYLSLEQAWYFALSAGDDYELCFTVPPNKEKALQEALETETYTRIGSIETESGLRCLDEKRQIFVPKRPGYQHF
ncbi:thiamine-monophosphate kinase [Beggiatoa sp. PS]|nr:thiamine-monophosphate kinase [Beggiatoa sp. PS]